MISAQVTSSAHDAGVHAAAFTLATPASMLGQALGQVLVPAFAHRTDGGSLRSCGALLLVVGFGAASAVGLVPAALLLATGRSRQVALASVAEFVAGAGLMAVLGPIAGVAGGTTGFLVGSAANLITVMGVEVRRH